MLQSRRASASGGVHTDGQQSRGQATAPLPLSDVNGVLFWARQHQHTASHCLVSIPADDALLHEVSHVKQIREGLLRAGMAQPDNRTAQGRKCKKAALTQCARAGSTAVFNAHLVQTLVHIGVEIWCIVEIICASCC